MAAGDDHGDEGAMTTPHLPATVFRKLTCPLLSPWQMRHYCPHFTDGETEAWTLLEVTQYSSTDGSKPDLTINLGQAMACQLQGCLGYVLGFTLDSQSRGTGRLLRPQGSEGFTLR